MTPITPESLQSAGLDRIKSKTFRIEYSPACRAPFLIRFVGKNCGVIRGDGRDIMGYGSTLDEAIDDVFKKGE